MTDFTLTPELMDSWASGKRDTFFGMTQDEDLLIGEPKNVPLIARTLSRTDIAMKKRVFLVSALAEMLSLDRSEENVSDAVAAEIEAALRANPDAVEAAVPDLGMDAEAAAREALGLPISPEMADYIKNRDRYRRDRAEE